MSRASADPAPGAGSTSISPSRSKAPVGAGTALIATASFCCLVVALQQTLVVPAIPRFPALLGTAPGVVAWLVTATLLTGALATPIFGRLSDIAGKRRMMLISMAFVLVGSLLAPLGSVTTLIVGRALQGFGTALVPVAMAQLRDSLPKERVGGALALLSSTLGVGGSIGIPLGGVMLAALGWQWMFWLSAALSVASLLLIARFMPADHADDRGSFDVTGAVLLSVTLVALLLGISQGNAWGWASARTLGAIAAAILVGAAWAMFELRHRSPLIDIRASTTQALLFTNLSSLVLGVLMFTNLLLTTLRLQGPIEQAGFGWSAAAAGLAMLPSAAAMFAVAPISARVAERAGPRNVLVLGAVISVMAYALAVLLPVTAGLAIVWTTLVSTGVGIGYAALPMLIVRHAPLRETGAANGFNALLRAIGTAIASALVGAIAAGMAVQSGAVHAPSAAALTTIGTVGIALSGLAVVLAFFARDPRSR